MADLEDATQLSEFGELDIEMAGGEEVEGDNVGGPAGDEDEETKNGAVDPQTIFIGYLKSPIVKIIVGGGSSGDAEKTVLTAHEAILTPSPFFAEKLSSLADADARSIELPEETVDAVGCFLQYQYTGEYFPRRLPGIPDGLELHPSLPAVDDTGAQLLKHARVYTLAEKFGLPELKILAHSKIHRINSTAVGEIAYARYVYGKTAADDIIIRKPVAAFWATRSHVLRHEAEREFKSMCLEYPQFGFDVLSLVLDQKEKRTRDRDDTDTPGRGRKRLRPSVNI